MGGNTYAISGLVAKRRELSGQVEFWKEKIKGVKAQLDSIDGAIKVFDPEFDLRATSPKNVRSVNQLFAHGEATTLLMDFLKEAGDPVSTTEIAEGRKGHKLDLIDRKPFTASVFMTLKRLEDKGIAEIAVGRIALPCGRYAVAKQAACFPASNRQSHGLELKQRSGP